MIIDIDKFLEDISKLSKIKEYEKVKNIMFDTEKKILDSYNESDFYRLIDNIMIYTNYSFFNSLIADYQYHNILELGTKNNFEKRCFKVKSEAKPINILVPDKFNGLDILTLYDCKDTNMRQVDYKKYSLPPLFFSSYDDIYNSYVKAIYKNGYKVIYCNNINSKYTYNDKSKIIYIRNGLSSKIKMLCMQEVFTSNLTTNDFEKRLLNYVINKEIGIDDSMKEKSILNWYKNTDIKDVEHTFKLISTKGRKFINDFNKFYELKEKEITQTSIKTYKI